MIVPLDLPFRFDPGLVVLVLIYYYGTDKAPLSPSGILRAGREVGPLGWKLTALTAFRRLGASAASEASEASENQTPVGVQFVDVGFDFIVVGTNKI